MPASTTTITTTTGTRMLAWAAIALLAFACARVGVALARIAPVPRPLLGARGLARSEALAAHPTFAWIEPGLRQLAAVLARAPIAGALRRALAQRLTEAGDPLGLDADECLALCCITGLIGAGSASYAAHALAIPASSGALFTSCAFALPLARVRGVARTRQRRIARELPAAIDLVALCMGAGVDFAAALALLVQRPTAVGSPLASEFGRALSEIALGRTRAEALSALAARAPSAAVRDFTAAVIHAEQKGSPLREAIAIQARMLRMKRSVAAEEAAARAAVLLAFPLLLLLASLLLVMLGPFFVQGVEL